MFSVMVAFADECKIKEMVVMSDMWGWTSERVFGYVWAKIPSCSVDSAGRDRMVRKILNRQKHSTDRNTPNGKN